MQFMSWKSVKREGLRSNPGLRTLRKDLFIALSLVRRRLMHLVLVLARPIVLQIFGNSCHAGSPALSVDASAAWDRSLDIQTGGSRYSVRWFSAIGVVLPSGNGRRTVVLPNGACIHGKSEMMHDSNAFALNSFSNILCFLQLFSLQALVSLALQL